MLVFLVTEIMTKIFTRGLTYFPTKYLGAFTAKHNLFHYLELLAQVLRSVFLSIHYLVIPLMLVCHLPVLWYKLKQ